MWLSHSVSISIGNIAWNARGILCTVCSSLVLRFDFQIFRAIDGYVITLNILEMEIANHPDIRGDLMVFDGDHDSDPLLATFIITNGTLPQGITSTNTKMLVRFSWTTHSYTCPLLHQCVKFTLLVDAGPGKNCWQQGCINVSRGNRVRWLEFEYKIESVIIQVKKQALCFELFCLCLSTLGYHFNTFLQDKQR